MPNQKSSSITMIAMPGFEPGSAESQPAESTTMLHGSKCVPKPIFKLAKAVVLLLSKINSNNEIPVTRMMQVCITLFTHREAIPGMLTSVAFSHPALSGLKLDFTVFL